MLYYHIRLGKQDSNICTIILPWGKYRYKRLTMVVINSPEILQEEMSKIFRGFGFIRSYIDDLLVITKIDWSNLLKIWN